MTKVGERDFDTVGFTASGGLKDVELMIASAEDVKLRLSSAEAARTKLEAAIAVISTPVFRSRCRITSGLSP